MPCQGSHFKLPGSASRNGLEIRLTATQFGESSCAFPLRRHPPLSPVRGEPVLLVSRRRRFGASHLHEPCGYRRTNVVLAEGGTMRQTRFRHQFGCGFRAFAQGREQPCYLVANLIGILVACCRNPKRLDNAFQHERHELGALALRRALPDGLVVVGPAGMNQALHGDIGKQRVPAVYGGFQPYRGFSKVLPGSPGKEGRRAKAGPLLTPSISHFTFTHVQDTRQTSHFSVSVV